MSDFHNEYLRKLAQRANAEQMSSVDSFVQGFLMGRSYEHEFNSKLHISILREMRSKEAIKYEEKNWWNDRISELELENFNLKSKYVWPENE